MALSADSKYLIVDSVFSSFSYLGKLDSFNGSVMSSYSSSVDKTYN